MRLDAAPSNAPEWTVSDLAGALKRTLEESFGYVRLRGEISGYRGPHGSGHAYFSLKDQDACIEACIWKGAFAKLRFKPQEGLEVIATGKITTFPRSSKYQIVVESLQPAGVGALMALLEERRRKLAAEGLFDPARKRRPPYLPGVVGVVTSPTGAVIRDILHRLADRFPRHVLVWPVRVQGESCADEVAAAIRGFNALAPQGAIPLISAVGHETDTTLIDHAADVRAPTPTAAAEKAVPVRVELLAGLADLARRHAEAMLRDLERRRSDLRATARALPTPEALFSTKRQRFDLAAAKLAPTFDRNRRDCEARLARTANALTRHAPSARLAAARARIAAIDGRPGLALGRLTQVKAERLVHMGQRLRAARDAVARAEQLRLAQRRDRSGSAGQRLVVALRGQLERKTARLAALSQLFESLNYKSVLARGYAIVRDGDREPISSAAAVQPAQALAIEFADGVVRTTADGPRPKRRLPLGIAQASLFDARG